MTTLGKRIRELREKQEWRQVDLGKRLGVTGSAVTQWERGQRVPDPTMLERIADLFHVSVDYLLGRDVAYPKSNEGNTMTIQDSRFTTRLQRLREEAGLSLRQLSERSDVPVERIASYENGTADYTGIDLVRLATALNVSASYLAGHSDDPEIKTQLPPELEQLVDEIVDGKLTVDDVRLALRMLRLARGEEKNGS